MLKRLFASISLLWIILIPSLVSADTARDTFEQFKKLEAQLGVGITYNDFTKGLGEVSYLVDRFDRETAALEARSISGQQLTQEEIRLWGLRSEFSLMKLELAITRALWESTLLGRYHDTKPDNPFWKDLLEKHPDANKDVKAGGIMGKVGKKKVIYLKPAMQLIWADVSLKLKVLERHFQQPPASSTQPETATGEKP